MKSKLGLSAIALPLALGAPAAAQPAMSYDSVVECAAFNMFLVQKLSRKAAGDANKAAIENYSNRTVALLVLAVATGKTTNDKVQADVTARNNAMLATLGKGDGSADELVRTNQASCDDMGKAAQVALDQMMAGKN